MISLNKMVPQNDITQIFFQKKVYRFLDLQILRYPIFTISCCFYVKIYFVIWLNFWYQTQPHHPWTSLDPLNTPPPSRPIPPGRVLCSVCSVGQYSMGRTTWSPSLIGFHSLPDIGDSMDDNKTTGDPNTDSTSLHMYILILPLVCVVVGMASLGVASVFIPNLFSQLMIHYFSHVCLCFLFWSSEEEMKRIINSRWWHLFTDHTWVGPIELHWYSHS